MSKPFASIIVPTYNQAQYLPAALDSLLAQTDGSWEAIVVDDGSTDGTPAVIADYARRDSRIRPIRKDNGGVASALNLGLAHATGRWVHWLSSDDMFEPGKLAINREWIARHPECKFFFSYFTLLRDATGVRERRGLWGPLPAPEHQILTLLHRNYISGITICVDRDAWAKIGHFDEALYYAQDYDQWLRLLHRHKAMFIPEWTVVNRNHALQGSETFPEACYLDTAKAAIRCVNTHSFQELVPWTDLSDPYAALTAVHAALDVAADPTSFLYALGHHPGLVLRLLDWITHDVPDAVLAKALKVAVEARVCEEALKPGQDTFRAMWQDLAAALAARSTRWVYRAVDPVALGLQLYAVRRSQNDPRAEPVRVYLDRFDDVRVPELREPGYGSMRIVVAMPDAGDRRPQDAVVQITEDLIHRGRQVIVVDPFRRVYDWQPHRTYLPRHPGGSRDLAWIGHADLAYAFEPEDANWLDAARTITLDPSQKLSSSRVVHNLWEAETASPGAEPRTVVFLQRVLVGGGAERVVLDLASRIDRRRFRPFIVTLFECPRDPAYPADVPILSLPAFLREIGVGALPPPPAAAELASLPEGIDPGAFDAFIEDCWPAAFALRTLMSNLGPDSALVTIMEEAVIAAWIAQNRPYIASLHTLESVYVPEMYGAARLPAARWAFAAACTAASRVVFPSAGCGEDLATHFGVPAPQIETLGNPIDCANLRRRACEPLGEDAALLDGRFTFVCLARLDWTKNHALLLEACARMVAQGHSFQVLCIGIGGCEAELADAIETRGLTGIVKLIGFRANPLPLLRQADGLVLTSRFESFALVLAEAMAVGTPVVSVDCPFGPRTVLDGDRFGLLTPVDADALAAAMIRLLSDPALGERLSAAGLGRAALFDTARIANAWCDLIDALLPAAPAPDAAASESEEDFMKLSDVSTETLAEELAARLSKTEGNPVHGVFYRHGFHLLKKHFYLPIPDDTDDLSGFWGKSSALAGLDMNDAGQLDLIERVLPGPLTEFRDRFPIQRPEGDEARFYLINGGYMAVDAHVYYSLIRHYKPKRILEIGCGNSTLLAIAANTLNEREGSRARLASVDPYPWDVFRGGYPGLDELIDRRVQDVPLSTFEELESGDILFIDSSHVIRSGNDVHFEFLEVLPRLKPGVFVHVHDISLPKPYPEVYYDNRLYWNEQYLLQAFLAFNDAFDVVWAGNYMMLKYPEKMHAVFPEMNIMRESYPQSEPSAFWMRVKGGER